MLINILREDLHETNETRKKKQYRIKNAEKVKEYNDKRKEKCECECGGIYTLNNKHHHERTIKHLEFERK